VPFKPGLIISFFLSFFVISGCMEQKKEPPAPSVTGSATGEQEGELLEFETYRVIHKQISEDITGLGSLVLCDRAEVVARIEGVVEQVFVKKGDGVEQNQVMFRLSNYQLELEKSRKEEDVLEAEQELKTVHIQLVEEEKTLYRNFLQIEKLDLQIENFTKEIAFLEENLERRKKLFQKGGITEEELRNLEFSLGSKKRETSILKKERELEAYGFRDEDLIQAGYSVPRHREEKRKLLIFINTTISRKKIEFAEIRLKKARMELDRIKWLLGHTEIKSPISGKVADIKKFAGEKVSEDEPVATVVGLDRLLARASFSEKDLFTLRECREVSVHIDSINREVKAEVYSIDPFINPDSRSFNVDCLVINSLGLLPGMFVKVSAPGVRQRKGVLIPVECFIQEEGDRGYVYVVSKNNRIFKRKVRGKKLNHRYIEVEQGLEVDEVVVKNPLINLLDGMRIVVKED